MKIAVNAQLLLFDRLEGIGRFAYETLVRMARNHPEHTFLLVHDRKADSRWDFPNNVQWVATRLPSRHPILWYLRFHWEIPALLRRHKPDIFFSPDGWSIPGSLPKVVVLHDLNFLQHPENLPFFARLYFRYFFPNYARQANKLITVSRFSAQDIHDTLGISLADIGVVYNAAGPDFKPLSDSENQSIRQTYNAGNAYLLFLGAQIPRKNLPRLLQALDLLWQEQPNAPNLLIVGEAMWSNSPVDLAVQGLKNPDKVRFTGRLQRNEVAKVVAAAHALLLPSLFEGFGIPVLEAMACGVPVLTSNCSSLPEVAGDAAVLVDPYSIADIKMGIERVWSDEALRLRCSEQGLKRAAEFSWDRSAEELYAHIQELAERNLHS